MLVERARLIPEAGGAAGLPVHGTPTHGVPTRGLQAQGATPQGEPGGISGRGAAAR